MDKISGCKYAVISYGIGLDNKVSEISVHCKMDSKNDYKEPIKPQEQFEIKPLPLVQSFDENGIYGYQIQLILKINEIIKVLDTLKMTEKV